MKEETERKKEETERNIEERERKGKRRKIAKTRSQNSMVFKPTQ